MRFGIFILLAFVGSALLNADTLSYTVVESGGAFSYAFALHSSGATGGTLYDLFVSVPLDINTIDSATIGTPVGWGDPTGGLLFFGPDAIPSTSFIEWTADFTGLYDVGIGNTLLGLSFQSTARNTTPVLFGLNGSPDLVTAQETSSTPEPSTFVLTLITLVVLAIRAIQTIST